MSWSVNWPTNVEPAVIVGLSGFVPYGFAGGRVAVDGRIDDQRLRPSGEVVVGVHDPARHANLDQCGPHRVGRRRERRQRREHPAEQYAAGRCTRWG